MPKIDISERRKDAFEEFIFNHEGTILDLHIRTNKNQLALALGLSIQLKDIDLQNIPRKAMWDEISFYVRSILDGTPLRPQIDRNDDKHIMEILKQELQRQRIQSGRSGRISAQYIQDIRDAYQTYHKEYDAYMKDISLMMKEPNMVDVYGDDE